MGNVRKKTSGTKEWADFNVNCVKGCANDCRYCYAKMMAKRFGRCTEDSWKNMVINTKMVDKKFKKYNGRVMFPSSHDIVDIPEVKEACFTVLKNLLDADNEVLVTMKPSLSVTKDVIEGFRTYKDRIQFRFTITSNDDEKLSFWEPNAPPFEERFKSLKYAYEKGFKTSVSIEPFLDYTPQILVNMLASYITESIWLGPMNYIPKNSIPNEDKQQYVEIRKKYEVDHLKEIFEDLKDFPLIRFKDSMTNRLDIFTCT